MNRQLPLAFRTGSDQRFIDYLGQDAVRVAVEAIAEGDVGHTLFLAGASGSGKTHLLRAAVNHANALSQTAAFVPCARMSAQLPQILVGLEEHQLVCLDDIQTIAGDRDAEVAMFHFFSAVELQLDKVAGIN